MPNTTDINVALDTLEEYENQPVKEDTTKHAPTMNKPVQLV